MNTRPWQLFPRRLFLEGIAAALILVGLAFYMIPRFMDAQSVRSFSGEVHAGETFKKPIGRELTFHMINREEGCEFTVACNVTDRILTLFANLPLYGVRATDIKGWHFRNADNTGPNDGSVNAPQRRREFYFFISEVDIERAQQFLNDLQEKPIGERYLETYRRVPRARGVLTITDMELSYLEPGQRASIEWMRFEVELHWP